MFSNFRPMFNECSCTKFLAMFHLWAKPLIIQYFKENKINARLSQIQETSWMGRTTFYLSIYGWIDITSITFCREITRGPKGHYGWIDIISITFCREITIGPKGQITINSKPITCVVCNYLFKIIFLLVRKFLNQVMTY